MNYSDGRTGLAEIVFTQRQSAYVSGEKRIGEAVHSLAGGAWSALADWRYEDLRSKAVLPDDTPANGLDNYTSRIPGIGVGAHYAFLGDRLEAALNLLWRHNEHASSRLSSGVGYRVPTAISSRTTASSKPSSSETRRPASRSRRT